MINVESEFFALDIKFKIKRLKGLSPPLLPNSRPLNKD